MNHTKTVIMQDGKTILVDTKATIKTGDTAYSVDIECYRVEHEDVKHANENHWKVII